MSGFTGEGFNPFPNTHEDNQSVAEFSMLADEALTHKIGEYQAFVTREKAMPRAIEVGTRILDHLTFEQDYRNGAYDEAIEAARQQETEVVHVAGELALANL